MVLFSSSRYSVSPLNLLISTVVAVHSLSHGLFVTPWTAASQDSPSFIISWSLLRFMSVESVMPSNHVILCHPLLLLPSIFPGIKVFSNESALRIGGQVLELHSASAGPSNEYSGLITFRWTGLLLSSKASILWHSAFFMVQLLDLYMTTGKTISLIVWCPDGGVAERKGELIFMIESHLPLSVQSERY